MAAKIQNGSEIELEGFGKFAGKNTTGTVESAGGTQLILKLVNDDNPEQSASLAYDLQTGLAVGSSQEHGFRIPAATLNQINPNANAGKKVKEGANGKANNTGKTGEQSQSSPKKSAGSAQPRAPKETLKLEPNEMEVRLPDGLYAELKAKRVEKGKPSPERTEFVKAMKAANHKKWWHVILNPTTGAFLQQAIAELTPEWRTGGVSGAGFIRASARILEEVQAKYKLKPIVVEAPAAKTSAKENAPAAKASAKDNAPKGDVKAKDNKPAEGAKKPMTAKKPAGGKAAAKEPVTATA